MDVRLRKPGQGGQPSLGEFAVVPPPDQIGVQDLEQRREVHQMIIEGKKRPPGLRPAV
jgi:hypothetical protein